MITGELKSKVDSIWNAMWTGGLSNPQTVMEQLTLLLFLKGLDDAQTLAERQARARGTKIERNLFPDELDGIRLSTRTATRSPMAALWQICVGRGSHRCRRQRCRKRPKTT